MNWPLCRLSKEPGWLCAGQPGQPWERDGCGAEGAACECHPAGSVVRRHVHADAESGERPTAAAIYCMVAGAPRRPTRRLVR